MAAHLKEQGVKPGVTVAMLAKNSAHFIIAELAIWMAGGTTVAIFPSETAENVRYVMEHSEARVLFVGKLDDWASQQAGVPAGVTCIALPLAPETGFETWDVMVGSTAPLPGRPPRAASDLAMLLYTSGSTGQPKGVMHTFGTVTAGTQGFVDRGVEQDGGVFVHHRILSYLPLAHASERVWAECRTLLSGRNHLFFTESQATFMDDLRRVRPTIFMSVPRLWSKFQLGVFARFPPAQLDAMLDNPATAAAAGRQVLVSLGLDAAVRAGTGSAPMPPALIAWYRRLGLALYEAYGMTEDFAYSHGSGPKAHAPGRVGTPNRGVQSRIAEDGEILVKSPGTMTGYYKQPELTAESFTADGSSRPAIWVATTSRGCCSSPGARRSSSRRPRASTSRRRRSRAGWLPTRWWSWRWWRVRASGPRMRWSCSTRRCVRGWAMPAYARTWNASCAPCCRR